MSDAAPGIPPAGGLRRALGRVGASVVGLARTRIELATIEFQEERERAVERLVLIAVALLGFCCALFMLTALVVVLFWDTHRVAAIACVTLFYVAVGAFALWRLSALQHSSPKPFAATLAELERDAQAFSDELHEH